MNTPTIVTKRLILRKFNEQDMDALFRILSYEQVNQFLPWYPVKDIEETKAFYQKHYGNVYKKDKGYAYAICLREDNIPIGFINIGSEAPYELGYGLLATYWHQGIASEAALALVNQVKNDGLPFIIATHDKNNPRSGLVMQKLGMKYCYTYQEQWQPKDISVLFRMYQLNFDTSSNFVYMKLWNESMIHYVENI